MSDKDLVVGTNFIIPTASKQTKPSYLISFPKGKKIFIATEQPKFEPAYIQVKGFYSEEDENQIILNYQNLIEENKTATVEMWFPWHVIQSVRSLVYKAK